MGKFREISQVPLRPVYTSLGFPPGAFAKNSGIKKSPFDAGTNCGPSFPDCLWLFQRADVYRFNVRSGEIEEGPSPLASIAKNWPPLFGAGIQAAVWAGSGYPNLHYFFYGDTVVRRNAATGLMDVGPANSIFAGFETLRNSPLAQELGYGFSEINPAHAGRVYLGKGDTILQHNLNTGQPDGPGESLSTKFHLTPPLDDVDVTFYGCGEEATTLYLFRGTSYIAVDMTTYTQIGTGEISDRFPVLARFMPRPQIFLVENYTLSNFCSDPVRGEFINQVTIMPRTKTTLTMTSEYETSSSSTQTSSILSNTSSESSKQFNDQLQNSQEEDRSEDTYKYDLSANMHGDADAHGVWGGEVNASLNVTGGSNDQRQHYADSAVSTVGKQVNSSNKSLKQQVSTGQQSSDEKTHVLNKQEQTVDNLASDKAIAVQFFQVVQPTYSVLSLTGASVGYSDGHILKVVDVSGLDALVQSALINDEDQKKARDAVVAILSNVLDHDKQQQSLLDPDRLTKGELRQRRELATNVTPPGGKGQDDSLSVEGIAIESKVFQVRMPETMILQG